MLVRSVKGLKSALVGVVRHKCDTYILQLNNILLVLRATSLFSFILLFLLSAHLDLSMAFAKIVEHLCLLEAWRGFNPP